MCFSYKSLDDPEVSLAPALCVVSTLLVCILEGVFACGVNAGAGLRTVGICGYSYEGRPCVSELILRGVALVVEYCRLSMFGILSYVSLRGS